MCSVGVEVDTTIEHSCSVLANAGVDHGTSTWVVLDEARDVMDNTSNADELAAILALVDVVVPLHNWQLLEGHAPVEHSTLLVQLLLQLLHSALLDLVGAELLQIVCEAELLGCPDEPLGWVILPPFDSVAEVGWELVVEVVVSLAEGHEGGEDVIAGSAVC